MKTPLKQKLVGQEFDTVILSDTNTKKRLIHKRDIRGFMDEIIMAQAFWVVYPSTALGNIAGESTKVFTDFNKAVEFYEKI